MSDGKVERMVAPARRRYTPLMAPWLKMQTKYGPVDAYIIYLLARGMNDGQVLDVVKGAGGCVMGPDGKPIDLGTTITAEYIVDLARRERKMIHKLAVTIVDEMEWGRALAGVTMAQERMLQVLSNPLMSEPQMAGDLVKIMNSFNQRLADIRRQRDGRLNDVEKVKPVDERRERVVEEDEDDDDAELMEPVK